MLATKDIKAARSMLTIVAAPLSRDSHPALPNENTRSLDRADSFDKAMARALTGGAPEPAATEPLGIQQEERVDLHPGTSIGESELMR